MKKFFFILFTTLLNTFLNSFEFNISFICTEKPSIQNLGYEQSDIMVTIKAIKYRILTSNRYTKETRVKDIIAEFAKKFLNYGSGAEIINLYDKNKNLFNQNTKLSEIASNSYDIELNLIKK